MKEQSWPWGDESGMTTVEYALLLSLLVVTVVGLWVGLGRTLVDAWWTASNHMEAMAQPRP
ncbi:MAG: Flp family type IVb pilin [Armatimonadetes bacterium]|nr:Flp family type IVb pilin [Armatimonadota bacterium]